MSKPRRSTADRPAIPSQRALLATVKGIHTLIWFLVEASVFHLVLAGLRKRTGRDGTIAGLRVAGEAGVQGAGDLLVQTQLTETLLNQCPDQRFGQRLVNRESQCPLGPVVAHQLLGEGGEH
jgi:hypothetical protein